MGKVIFDIGYGSDSPEAFLKRLKDAGVTIVLDVRYYQAARLGCYRATGYDDRGMAALLAGEPEDPIWEGIEYIWCPELGKPKEIALDDYVQCVLETETNKKILKVALYRIGGHKAPCLLCSEGNPFEKDGVKPRCHRVYVADALVKLLGDEWEVKHL